MRRGEAGVQRKLLMRGIGEGDGGRPGLQLCNDAFRDYRPEEIEFRLNLPLQTIEDGERGTIAD